jgi:hypothetical protein
VVVHACILNTTIVSQAGQRRSMRVQKSFGRTKDKFAVFNRAALSHLHG